LGSSMLPCAAIGKEGFHATSHRLALGISEETIAPEDDLLCLLDYRGSRLASFCEYRIHLPLLSHVVRQREAREPNVL